MGRSYPPSGDRTFLLPPDDILSHLRKIVYKKREYCENNVLFGRSGPDTLAHFVMGSWVSGLAIHGSENYIKFPLR